MTDLYNILKGYDGGKKKLLNLIFLRVNFLKEGLDTTKLGYMNKI